MKAVQSIFWLILIVILLLAADYVMVRAKDSRAGSVVHQLGGKMYSIPLWPLGTEYRVSFDSSPTVEQIQELRILNHLRDSVSVAFPECSYSKDQVNKIKETLSQCHLFSIEKRSRLVAFDSCEPE